MDHMTEVVDKTLIERLILEHSDRLELEINQKARADAWKFYYRVRVDHVVRPFAVCKVCYRVLHCDSRSGTASLLRHPCNPLSERSPVNRAVKLSAKLNLPSDRITKNGFGKREIVKPDFSSPFDISSVSNLCSSPVPHLVGSNTPTSNRSSPTSGCSGSPPSTNSPLNLPTYNVNGGKKRKAGSVAHSAFPLDLRLLQLPQMMAAVASHPLAALSFANATALLSDPQHFNNFQQQQSHIESILREHHIQQERELKRNREEEKVQTFDRNGNCSGESTSSNSPTCSYPKVQREISETNERIMVDSYEGNRDTENHLRRDQNNSENHFDDRVTGAWMSKEVVQHLVNNSSDRVRLADKDSSGSHYISDVWSRFEVVYVDDMLRPFASCKKCHKVVTYTKYSGTGGLLRHRCSLQDGKSRISPVQDFSANSKVVSSISNDVERPPKLLSLVNSAQNSPPSYKTTRESFNLQNDYQSSEVANGSLMTGLNSNSRMSDVARALLRYMCHDLISASAFDTPAFQNLLTTVMNLRPLNGSVSYENFFPSSKQLLKSYLPPIVVDSKEIISRDLQNQNYLCFSLFCRKHDGDNILSASVHYITKDFVLHNHALGRKVFYKDETCDEALHVLLRDFFMDSWSSTTFQEKYLTVVTDEELSGDILGSTGVRCFWHCVELTLENLTDVVAYSNICNDIRTVLAFLADSGMEDESTYNFRSNEVHRWEALLHAIAFILSHYDELKTLISSAQLTAPSAPIIALSEREIYEEIKELLVGVRRSLMTVRDFKRPTLNQTVFCRSKLLQLCSSPSNCAVIEQLKEYLRNKLESALVLGPLHLVANFLDPRCKNLQVLTEGEKGEVHRLVLEMMKAVSVTEANSGVLNLKTTRLRSPSLDRASQGENPASEQPAETNSLAESSGNHPGSDLSVSDSEEIMAYVNTKVHLDTDDILSWWAGPSSSGLPTLRRLARKVLAVPATCAFACQIDSHAVAASEKMGIADQAQVNNILHVRYNMN